MHVSDPLATDLINAAFYVDPFENNLVENNPAENNLVKNNLVENNLVENNMVGIVGPWIDAGKEYFHKICICGDIGTGKTSFVKKLVHDIFSIHYKATIGVDFATKMKKVGADTFRLQFWDIAGPERIANKTRNYYPESIGVFVVVDCTRFTTLEGAIKWKADIDTTLRLPKYSPETNPVVLLINKMDLLDDKTRSKLNFDIFCKNHGFHSWIATSAKTGEGIEEACDAMIGICKNVVLEEPKIKPTAIPVPKPIPVPEPAITANKFIRTISLCLEKVDTNDTELVSILKSVFLRLYFTPEMISIRKEICYNQNLHDITRQMHKILVDESISDSSKITQISNFMMDFGLSHNI